MGYKWSYFIAGAFVNFLAYIRLEYMLEQLCCVNSTMIFWHSPPYKESLKCQWGTRWEKGIISYPYFVFVALRTNSLHACRNGQKSALLGHLRSRRNTVQKRSNKSALLGHLRMRKGNVQKQSKKVYFSASTFDISSPQDDWTIWSIIDHRYVLHTWSIHQLSTSPTKMHNKLYECMLIVFCQVYQFLLILIVILL